MCTVVQSLAGDSWNNSNDTIQPLQVLFCWLRWTWRASMPLLVRLKTVMKSERETSWLVGWWWIQKLTSTSLCTEGLHKSINTCQPVQVSSFMGIRPQKTYSKISVSSCILDKKCVLDFLPNFNFSQSSTCFLCVHWSSSGRYLISFQCYDRLFVRGLKYGMGLGVGVRWKSKSKGAPNRPRNVMDAGLEVPSNLHSIRQVMD